MDIIDLFLCEFLFLFYQYPIPQGSGYGGAVPVLMESMDRPVAAPVISRHRYILSAHDVILNSIYVVLNIPIMIIFLTPY